VTPAIKIDLYRPERRLILAGRISQQNFFTPPETYSFKMTAERSRAGWLSEVGFSYLIPDLILDVYK
jgi:hypothetical protein